MKKRQNRFQETTSKTLEQLEAIEKRKQRRLKFGAIQEEEDDGGDTGGKVSAQSLPPTIDLMTALKKRSEKFKITSSPTLMSFEELAKLETRKKRFNRQ
jgi:hypothetical protein